MIFVSWSINSNHSSRFSSFEHRNQSLAKKCRKISSPGVALFFLSSLNPAVECEPLVTLPTKEPRFTGNDSGEDNAQTKGLSSIPQVLQSELVYRKIPRKYPLLITDTEVNNCFIVLRKQWITRDKKKMNFIWPKLDWKGDYLHACHPPSPHPPIPFFFLQTSGYHRISRAQVRQLGCTKMDIHWFGTCIC